MHFAAMLLLAYLLGSIPTGLLLARRSAQLDIRAHGSGNIGATNVARVLGYRLGALTLLGDALKGFAPAALSLWWGWSIFEASWVALAAFLGHCYSLFLKLDGGKGVAVALGGLAALTPGMLPPVLLVWLFLYRWKRKSSLATLLVLPLSLLALALYPPYRPALPAVLLMELLMIWRHRENIQRLRQGREL